MQSNRYILCAATALSLVLAAQLPAQEAGEGAATTPEAPATDAPASVAPATDAPVTETPAPPDPAADAGPETGPELSPEPGTDAPDQPEITVTNQGDWEVGCVTGTTNCEMQQVASDATDNPVLLVRVVKLPQGSEAPALAIINTPLGTLLPPGLGFQIDSGPVASLPFEWCVQEGCIVRLGVRNEDIAAMKRGREVKLKVVSIADPQLPVDLTLSLSGFTAAFDSLTAPAAAQPAPPTDQ